MLLAIERADLNGVREELSSIPDGAVREAALLRTSTKMEHNHRTPLMAAAASGKMSILGMCDKKCRGLSVGGIRFLLGRGMVSQYQLYTVAL